MGAPSIKRDLLKEHGRVMKMIRRRDRAWFCTVLQDPDGKVLGVAMDRNAIGKLYERLTADGVDSSRAECKDFEVIL